MRKACIDLMDGTKVTCLLAGDIGTGRYLYMVIVSEGMTKEPSTAHWANALSMCQQKAVERKYEVTRIRGKGLTGLPR